MKSDITKIKQKALPILKQAGVNRSAIFGSHARGDQKKDSDIDILVDLPKSKSLLDFVSLKLKLEKALKKKVDLGEYDTLKPRLKRKVSSEQVTIL